MRLAITKRRGLEIEGGIKNEGENGKRIRGLDLYNSTRGSGG
jgi:hypothetical protein